ncbi:AzlD domain-containing protein [Nocardioides donggukensis]|uniref:AzlD domain-containing protein n=1 Tax=Nocardioides donggukensis TaxID=2774019 RepID=A0A927K6H3_9ACTN|nr:AzlD domain-containing protein [Nocardioides donggukensis]MBD8871099.1 AzlD domain-containing protein [Nocardioides donggukensis]
MIGTTAILVSGAVLGLGTFGYRVAGPLLRTRFTPSPWTQELMTTGATVLLFALVVTSAVADGREPADLARPAGVLVGGVLAWKRAPFVVVVLAAAGTAALLRLLVR